MTKNSAKPAANSSARVKVASACGAGATNGGMYGFSDLFTYASEFAAKRQDDAAQPQVRITHW
jgi:hypothetical protein